MVSRRSVLAGLGTVGLGAGAVGAAKGHIEPSDLLVFPMTDGDESVPASDPTPTATATPEPEPKPEIDVAAAAGQIRDRINAYRVNDRDLPPLEYSACAEEQALDHARDMVQQEYFAHTSLDGETQNERYATCGRGGENLAKMPVQTEILTPDGGTAIIETTDELAEATMNEWLTSQGHREKGIFGDWSATGSGFARHDETNTVYAVTGFID